MSSPAALDHLLAHEPFVRHILRGLLRDEARVDDAMQDVWLRTLQHRGGVPREPRSWLARIARNLAISNWRSDRRRSRRERDHGAEPADESAERSQQRLELRQRVVAAILTLDEPYRSVVLLRHEQQLPVAEIAGRLQHSAATVRSQLSRAHEQLRQKLDRDYGSRERWAALAVTMLGAAPAAGLPAGALAVACGLAVLAVAWASWWLSTAAPVAAPVASAPAPTPSAPPADAAVGALAAHPATPPPQRAAAATADDVLLLPPAELFDRAWFHDYERGTFSFLWGTRDDPDRALVRNDWDIAFAQDRFDVVMVTDDSSVLADLGPVAPAAFGAFEIGTLAFAERLPVVADHAYFVLTRDTDSELVTVVFVRRFEPGRRVEFDWYTTDGSPRAQGSLPDPGTGRPWTQVLRELREAARKGPPPPSPVVLQLRGGAGGGNPNRVDFAGRTNGYVRERSAQPLDLDTAPAIHDRIRAFADTGHVPPGHRFVVTDVVFRGGAHGDSNGPGGFRVCVAGEMLADVGTRPEPIDGAWRGSLAIESGAEANTWFETRNSSWGEVRLFGRLVASPAGADRAFAAPNVGFRSGRRPVLDPTPALTTPEVVLQARPGSRHGSATIDLRGRVDERIGTLQPEPIDLTATDVPRDGLAYATGGLVPAGQVFVVTEATLRGTVGEPPRAGGVRLELAGETVWKAPGAGPYEATWTGRVEIPPGEESRTRLLVGARCAGEVVLRGHFAPR